MAVEPSNNLIGHRVSDANRTGTVVTRMRDTPDRLIRLVVIGGFTLEFGASLCPCAVEDSSGFVTIAFGELSGGFESIYQINESIVPLNVGENHDCIVNSYDSASSIKGYNLELMCRQRTLLSRRERIRGLSDPGEPAHVGDYCSVG